jgi:hypothetical protein
VSEARSPLPRPLLARFDTDGTRARIVPPPIANAAAR